jgi:hypothetical protein
LDFGGRDDREHVAYGEGFGPAHEVGARSSTGQFAVLDALVV